MTDWAADRSRLRDRRVQYETEGLDVGEIVVADAGTSLHDGDQIKTIFAEELDRTRVR